MRPQSVVFVKKQNFVWSNRKTLERRTVSVEKMGKDNTEKPKTQSSKTRSNSNKPAQRLFDFKPLN